jgi:Rhodopirellula transposase DDE domain
VQPPLAANLCHLLQAFTAGDPMRAGVLWTNLSLRALSRRLVALGTPASRRTIRRLLRKRKLGRRTARKKKTMGHHPDRNAQCENIARLRRAYEAAGDAVIAIDTKKKALLGNFHRTGTTFTAETVETFDHDFRSAGQGKLIPPGVYDLVNHHAHIHLNTSHDTSA